MNGFISRLYIFIAIVTVLVYFSINIPPDLHEVMILIPLLIPILLILNAFFLVYWLLRGKILLVILTVFVLGVGYKFIVRTYNINYSQQTAGTVKLLSYNVRIFNSYRHLKSSEKSSQKLVNWVVENNADIKCLQEFFHYPDLDSYNVIPKLRRNTPYYYFKPASIVRNQYFGQAIFSKHPIIGEGFVPFEKISFNQAIFADIVIKEDTVRVYNVHLQSMSIDEKDIPTPDSENMYDKLKYLFKKIIKGAIPRSRQVQALIAHMQQCPYKIILAGDLNDTPYSYTYEILRTKFNNAFEEKGAGLGFTYNGKLFFLRIDNIFLDKRIIVNTFNTKRDVIYSDHFPIEVTYTF